MEYLSPDNLMGQQTWNDLRNIDITSVEKNNRNYKDRGVITNKFSLAFNIAKEKERKSCEDNNVYEVAPYNHQKCILARSVLSQKEPRWYK